MTTSTITAQQIEHVVFRRLDDLLGAYLAGLRGDGDAELNAFGCRIRVDRLRGLVVPSDLGRPAMWDTQTGSISNRSTSGRTALTLFIGQGRCLTAKDWINVLSLIARSDDYYSGSETGLCRFLNLALVERGDPVNDLAIWVTVARLVASGRREDDVHTVMPPLRTDYDVLYEQIPIETRERSELLPSDGEPGHREPLPRHAVRLLAEVCPDLARDCARCIDDDDRIRLFRFSETALRAYVRTHVWSAVATLVARE